MAQAYKCDECGKLIETSARVSGEHTFKRTSEYRPVKIRAELNLLIEDERPDLCRVCMERILKEVTIQGGD